MCSTSTSETAHGERRAALAVVADRLREGIAAKKCHSCGCFQSAVTALEKTEAGRSELAEVLESARTVLVDKDYDCLGCAVCYPAIANLSEKLAVAAPSGLALTGTLHTENLGIERIVRNVLANPNLRFLVVCGEDTRQAIGHLPGQSLAALCTNGVDEAGRILGAPGKRPVLKNVRREQVDAFRRQVELVALIGELDRGRVAMSVNSCAERNPGPFEARPSRRPFLSSRRANPLASSSIRLGSS